MASSNTYRLLKIVWVAGLVGIPLFWWTGAPVPFEIPKVVLFQRWVEILTLLTIFNRNQIVNRGTNKSVVWGMWIFLAAVVAGTLTGVDIQKSIVGNYWRGDGLLTLGHLAGLAVIVSLWWDKKWEKLTIRSIAFGVGINLVSAVGELIFHPGSQLALSFGQPKFLAGWLLVSGVLVDRLVKKWGRVMWLGVLMVIGVTWSWSTLALAIIYTATFRKWLIVVGVILVGVIGWYWWPTQHVRFVGTDGVVAFESRERIFTKILLGWQTRPILGWGWANVDYAFEAVDWPVKVQDDVYVDKAHSNLLEVLATTGVVGLVAYILLIGGVLKVMWRTEWIWPLGAYLIHSQTNVTSIAEEMVFWLIVGIAMSGGLKKE